MAWLTLVTRLTLLPSRAEADTYAKMIERHFNLFNNDRGRGTFSII